MKKSICVLFMLCIAMPVTAASYRATVISVKDGDTMTIKAGSKIENIHLAFVDCPEPGQPFFNEATLFTSTEVLGKEVAVISKDRKYGGQLLVEIILLSNGHSLNYMLVEEGFAWPDNKRPSTIATSLASKAKEKKIGLWAQFKPTPPWKTRNPDEALLLSYAHVLGRSTVANQQAQNGTKKFKHKYVSAQDYQVSSSARQSGDFVLISGRISSGPACQNLRVTAYATSSYGKSISISDVTSMSKGVKSVLFEGKKYYPFRKRNIAKPQWEVSNVYIDCRP